MADERRRHIRVRVDLPSAYVFDGNRIEAHIGDMSPGGAFIDTTAPIPPFGTQVIVEMQFPGNKLVRINAIVRWAKPGGMGVQFGMLGAKDTFVITEHLAGLELIPDSRRF
jgi:type IV pilus assembly protein PilZ